MKEELIPPSSLSITKEYQDVIDKIGRNGNYQRQVFNLLSISGLFLNGMFCLLPFNSAEPEYTCTDLASAILSHYPHEECPDLCPKGTVALFEITAKTILTDYRQLCTARVSYDILTSFAFLVKLILIIVLSYMADKIGRIRTIQIYTGYSIVIYSLLMFTHNVPILFLGCGILSGNLVHYISTIVVSSELFDQKLNSAFNAWLGVFFSIGGLIQTALFWYFENWKVNLAVLNVVHIIFFLFILRCRWEPYDYLLNLKQYASLNVALENIAIANDTLEKVKPKLEMLKHMEDFKMESPGTIIGHIKSILSPYVTLINDKESFRILLGLFMPAYVIEFLYFGQVLNAEKIGGDLYLNLFMLFLSEATVELILVKVLDSCPRVKALKIGTVLSATICLIIHFLEDGNIKLFFLFCNSTAATANILILSMYASELFPPKFKGTAVSMTMNLACVSIIIQPLFAMIFSSIMLQFSLFGFGTLWFMRDMKETLI